jgi:N-acyl-D-amino-acid deacylase
MLTRTVACLVIAGASAAFADPGPATRPAYDVLIRGGRVIDGTGNPWARGDVAISAGRIAAIGDLSDATATEVIDATGRVVAPGFIDVHTHADEDLYELPAAENFVRNGVTTIVTGNCGYGARDVAGYFENLRTRGVAVNVATLYGHNTILRAVKGDKAGDLTTAQMRQALELVDQAMRDGAVGLSTGLIYTPGKWSSTEEIVELARVVAGHGGIYASHMRSEGLGILEAIDEAVRIGREAGLRVQISHFKMPTDYAARVGGTDATLARVEAARAAGLEVWVDQYPYTASSTSISTMLPDWVLEHGADEARRLLASDDGLRRVLDDMRQTYEVRRGRTGMDYVVIASCRSNPEYQGKTLRQVAQMRRLAGANELLADPKAAAANADVSMEEQYRAAIDIWLAGGASCVFHSMDEAGVEAILRHPLVGVASDSGVREFGAGQPHPRGYGTNTRVLGRYVRERGLIGLEEAVRKMTSMPATAFRFTDRGVLRVGAAADVVVFDPNAVADKATFEQPHQYPQGIGWVVVNGRVVLRDGIMTGELPGAPIHGPGKRL